MTSQDFVTLAYAKSPKASRRTTFQDELQAAVSARASKTKADQYSYSDDFNDDEDDFLNQLLKSRKKKSSTLKTEKSKAKINDFDISDDESKQGRTKRVSFLKTQRVSSPPGSTAVSESHENKSNNNSVDEKNDYNSSFSSQHSTNVTEDNDRFKISDMESSDSRITRQSSNKSLSYQTSGDSLLDMPLPLPSDNSVTETPEEKSSPPETPQLSATDLKHESSADSATEREPPRPKPRQRTLGLSQHAPEKIAEGAECQDVSRPQTSSASIPLSTGTDSNTAWTEGVSCSLSKFSSSRSDLSMFDCESRKSLYSDGSKEEDRKYSTSFEEFNQDSGDHADDQKSNVQEKSSDSRKSSSVSRTTQRSHSVCSREVESKYLGSLKVLDREVSLQESQPKAADSLRAAVYQEWLKKKNEKSKENKQLKKKEETLREKKERDEKAKKEDAVASYESWKQKKAESLKAKVKEKQDMIRKEQRAMQDKVEKRDSAKQVFEKWKQEHDHLLKEKYRKQKEAENKHKLKKKEKEEERKRESNAAFFKWSEKKKDILHERDVKEQKEIRTKAEEESYIKEDRDKMALEMYENWVRRKDLEQERRREERRVQAILRESPPPPWSPPNKTIPFRK